ncbi:DNA processing protein [Desulfonatronum thiosulfatophilum]|uniref:DNA processing protein n=1 Tax=Desulfonatronum thiosulfatophilum TaxID=617002 RepID=A0A1G6DYH0_9BACT|nr:DNA-processing protein DprA [Desulfonatronum thiosulfatophilum]SDB49795.1 DNA processing protein [Desulfonatronum thiosulfatophilum]
MQTDRKDEYLASLALRNTLGVGPRTWKKILTHYGRADVAVEHAGQWLELGLVNKAQLRDFQAKSWQNSTELESGAALKRDMDVLLWSDLDYPEVLRRIPDPPALLYVLGDRGLLRSPALAVVGSRKCSRYGLTAAGTICRDVSRAGLCVVSGFAAGIDRQAHDSALEGIGSSIAVLGTGLDLLYPAANRDLWLRLSRQGLIVSEFAPGTKPDAANFPHRNRIISGLSLGVLVIEAAVRSGSLITATTALEQGREVFALPGPVNLESYNGCHHLIRQGATLVRTAEDILVELRALLAAEGMSDLSPAVSSPINAVPPDCRPSRTDRRTELGKDELALVALLEEQGKVHIDALCNFLDRDPAEISRKLLLLEMESFVTQHPGMYYSLSD